MQPKGAISFNDPKPDNQDQPKNPVEQGHEDFLKESVKEGKKSVQKLDDLTQIAQLVLFRAKTANPIDLFPDEIIIDVNKVSVIYNQFFLTSRVQSVMIKDVSAVFNDTGFFWSKLSIIDGRYLENAVIIRFLKNDDATKARRIIQGLVVAQQEIDLTKLSSDLSPQEIIEKIEELGNARHRKVED